MISADHKKHADLRRPAGGKFHSNELGFIGAPCGVIQGLARTIAENLEEFRFGYADAAHGAGETDAGPYLIQYTDKISRHELSWDEVSPEYHFRPRFRRADAVLVNGNHFGASRQVVIVHPDKEDSLRRKLDRLTDVALVLLAESITQPFDFLADAIHGAPVLSIDQTSQIIDEVRKIMVRQKPVLKGLVLAGGRSLRMGTDKGSITYHGVPQREYAAGLLAGFCEEVYISVRPDQVFDTSFTLLPDTFVGLGPYGGILSAFRNDPDAAWLVVACDLPLLDRNHLAYLNDHRDISSIATCFHNPATGFPEPLITIWEPRAYGTLLDFLAMGYSCPRKVLINSDVRQIEPRDTVGLTNVNTPEERADARARLDE